MNDVVKYLENAGFEILDEYPGKEEYTLLLGTEGKASKDKIKQVISDTIKAYNADSNIKFRKVKFEKFTVDAFGTEVRITLIVGEPKKAVEKTEETVKDALPKKLEELEDVELSKYGHLFAKTVSGKTINFGDEDLYVKRDDHKIYNDEDVVDWLIEKSEEVKFEDVPENVKTDLREIGYQDGEKIYKNDDVYFTYNILATDTESLGQLARPYFEYLNDIDLANYDAAQYDGEYKGYGLYTDDDDVLIVTKDGDVLTESYEAYEDPNGNYLSEQDAIYDWEGKFTTKATEEEIPEELRGKGEVLKVTNKKFAKEIPFITEEDLIKNHEEILEAFGYTKIYASDIRHNRLISAKDLRG